MIRNERSNFASTARVAGVISSALVAPLLLLELRFGSSTFASFPYTLFGVLWFLPLVFVITAKPLLQPLGARTSVLAHPAALVIRLSLLGLISFAWLGIVADQLPCFLGVPNCD
jgi:hypothetical protein